MDRCFNGRGGGRGMGFQRDEAGRGGRDGGGRDGCDGWRGRDGSYREDEWNRNQNQRRFDARDGGYRGCDRGGNYYEDERAGGRGYKRRNDDADGYGDRR
ncbi:uncharacterized protein [Miscanthus floridulus]|uniref:uncharacterized protein n=1 Tax=Miscanthus floridulus TaxID=154761 RepID=UPI003457E725